MNKNNSLRYFMIHVEMIIEIYLNTVASGLVADASLLNVSLLELRHWQYNLVLLVSSHKKHESFNQRDLRDFTTSVRPASKKGEISFTITSAISNFIHP